MDLFVDDLLHPLVELDVHEQLVRVVAELERGRGGEARSAEEIIFQFSGSFNFWGVNVGLDVILESVFLSVFFR